MMLLPYFQNDMMAIDDDAVKHSVKIPAEAAINSKR